MFKGCTKGHCNHCNLNTFYPIEADCIKNFFTYDGAYTMSINWWNRFKPRDNKVGGKDSTPEPMQQVPNGVIDPGGYWWPPTFQIPTSSS
jgi:hypothetical protein